MGLHVCLLKDSVKYSTFVHACCEFAYNLHGGGCRASILRTLPHNAGSGTEQMLTRLSYVCTSLIHAVRQPKRARGDSCKCTSFQCHFVYRTMVSSLLAAASVS
jgi:hypothetical protein